MDFQLIPITQLVHKAFGLGACVVTCTIVISVLVGCNTGCPEGYAVQGKNCNPLESSLATDAAAQDDADVRSRGTNSGAVTATAGAGGSAASKPPPIDPTTQWMCMKSDAGQCTSCKQDNDCPKRVCEQGFCMDCRDTSQCAGAETCISHRCVPDRKPSSIWSTTGGGQTNALGFKLQLSVGTPSPAASASTSGYKLHVTPGAGLF